MFGDIPEGNKREKGTLTCLSNKNGNLRPPKWGWTNQQTYFCHQQWVGEEWRTTWKKETNVNHGAVHFKSQSMLFGGDQAFANGTAWWDDITVLQTLDPMKEYEIIHRGNRTDWNHSQKSKSSQATKSLSRDLHRASFWRKCHLEG